MEKVKRGYMLTVVEVVRIGWDLFRLEILESNLEEMFK